MSRTAILASLVALGLFALPVAAHADHEGLSSLSIDEDGFHFSYGYLDDTWLGEHSFTREYSGFGGLTQTFEPFGGGFVYYPNQYGQVIGGCGTGNFSQGYYPDGSFSHGYYPQQGFGQYGFPTYEFPQSGFGNGQFLPGQFDVNPGSLVSYPLYTYVQVGPNTYQLVPINSPYVTDRQINRRNRHRRLCD